MGRRGDELHRELRLCLLRAHPSPAHTPPPRSCRPGVLRLQGPDAPPPARATHAAGIRVGLPAGGRNPDAPAGAGAAVFRSFTAPAPAARAVDAGVAPGTPCAPGE